MPVLDSIEKKQKMEAETRIEHYARVAYIALRLGRGIYENDEELSQGIALAALYHDYGQEAFGHNGEVAISRASQNNGAGFRGHNIMGAMQILYDERTNIINAISEGIKEEIKTKKAMEQMRGNDIERYIELNEQIKKMKVEMQERVDKEYASLPLGVGRFKDCREINIYLFNFRHYLIGNIALTVSC